MTRGQAFRYTGWMVWDRHLPRLAGCVVMAAAIMLPIWLASRNRPIPPSDAANILSQVHQQFAFVFALLLANGIIAVDRVQNYFRFYLAKPVSPLWFYGEHIGLAAVFFMAASAALITLFSLAVTPVWAWHLLQRALVLWLLIGMPVVLCSALSRHDWLWGIVPWLLAAVLRGRFPQDESTLGGVFHVVLPPYHLMGNQVVVTAAGWLWMSAWALGFFVLTMVLLARRPLAED